MTIRQLAFDLPHKPAMTAADFVVGPGNEDAFNHVMAWPDWPVSLTVITGPAKAGKSHLAGIWAQRAGGQVLPADHLEDVAPGGLHPLAIEDADRGLPDETALFNVLNQAVRGERSVVVTARAPLERWPMRTQDVRSRLRLAAAFDVEPLDDAHLSQMFVKLFGDRQVVVEPSIIRYVLARMERSPEEVVALVDLMDRIALSKGRSITRTTAFDALAMRAEQRGTRAD